MKHYFYKRPFHKFKSTVKIPNDFFSHCTYEINDILMLEEKKFYTIGRSKYLPIYNEDYYNVYSIIHDNPNEIISDLSSIKLIYTIIEKLKKYSVKDWYTDNPMVSLAYVDYENYIIYIDEKIIPSMSKDFKNCEDAVEYIKDYTFHEIMEILKYSPNSNLVYELLKKYEFIR